MDLCTLAEQNYINDSVIDSILKIFGAYKIQTIDYNDFVLLSVYFYTFITNKDFASAFKLLENFLDKKKQVKRIYIVLHIHDSHWTVAKLDIETKKIYYGDSLKSSAPRDLIRNINGFFGLLLHILF